MYTNKNQVADIVTAIVGFFCIMAGACCIGICLAIIKAVLLLFGIENNL